MQHIPIPSAVLLRLAPRISTLFSESDLALDHNVRYLFRELVAAAKLAALDDDVGSIHIPAPSSPHSRNWDLSDSSSTVVDHLSTRASTPQCFNDSDSDFHGLDNDYLPPSSPPTSLADLDLPPYENTQCLDEPSDDLASTNGPRGVKRMRSATDTGQDTGIDRAQRASRRQAACDRDLARMADIQVMGHNWTPDCHRAGNRAPRASEVITRELHDGVPMIQGIDGLEPDPSVSEDNPYAPGVGYGSKSGEIRSGTDADKVAEEGVDMGTNEETPKAKGKEKRGYKGKGVAKKGEWQEAVRLTRLKAETEPLLSLLTDISMTMRESDLWTLANALCYDAQPIPCPSSSPIAQIVQDLKGIKKDTCVLDFYRMIKVMQLAILFDVYVFLTANL